MASYLGFTLFGPMGRKRMLFFPLLGCFLTREAQVNQLDDQPKPLKESSSSFFWVDVVASGSTCHVPSVPKRPLLWLEDDDRESTIGSSSSQAPPKRRIKGKQRLAIEDSK